MNEIRRFLERKKPKNFASGTALSLFSGAGISDSGYTLAGFRFTIHVEKEPRRAKLGETNFPESAWVVGDVRDQTPRLVKLHRVLSKERLDLLVATPPCQGMSSSNPTRGKRQDNIAKEQEEKNKLLLSIIPIVGELKPRVIVIENVRPLLTLHVTHKGLRGRAVDILRHHLKDYEFFDGIIDVADYGIPQTRKRAIVVGVNKNEPWLNRLIESKRAPWPAQTHSEKPENGSLKPWVSIREWLEYMSYESLDSVCEETAKSHLDKMHYVPHYEDKPNQYLMIKDIPPYSGKSGYDNSRCLSCGFTEVPLGIAECNKCGKIMNNRPVVIETINGNVRSRLVKGFKSSYRRMYADRPAATITTNTSHIGSDYKIHPWENRTLSAREVADLQTVPRFFDWSYAENNGIRFMIRTVIGEAFPAYFTYLHGKLLGDLLKGKELPLKRFARHEGYKSLPLIPVEASDIEYANPLELAEIGK